MSFAWMSWGTFPGALDASAEAADDYCGGAERGPAYGGGDGPALEVGVTVRTAFRCESQAVANATKAVPSECRASPNLAPRVQGSS